MIKPFEYYLQKKFARKSSANVSLAKSLLNKAELRLERFIGIKIVEKEASIVFEDVYECLRESAQSLMEIKGFKPYSHEALISFLKEQKLLGEEEVNILDNYRILRNNSVYRAENVSLEKSIEALKFAKKILPEIKKKFADVTRS